MKTYTVDAEPIKAAMLHSADKDVRYYLNGIYLDADNGRVIGTNGHTAVIVYDEKVRELSTSMIVKISGTVPAKATRAHIVTLDDRHGYLYYDQAKSPVEQKGQLVRHFYDVIEGKYPEIETIKKRFKPEATPQIVVNGEYMGLAAKTVRALRAGAGSGLNLTFSGENDLMRAVGGDQCSHEHEIYIMPMRMDR